MVGQYIVKSADGTIKILAKGSYVFEDDIITGRSGLELEIGMNGGGVLELKGNEVAHLTQSVTSKESLEPESTQIDIKEILALSASGDIVIETLSKTNAQALQSHSSSSGAETLFALQADDEPKTRKTNTPNEGQNNEPTKAEQSVADGESQPVNIGILNSAPTITSAESATVLENESASTVIYQAAASDVDASSTLTYSLGGADAALLSIDSSSGEVRLLNPADFESKSIYNFTVSVSDGSLSDTKAVSLAVTDVVENLAPTSISLTNAASANISGSNGSFNVLEDYSVGTFGTANTNGAKVIGTLATIDPDSGDTFTYTLNDPSGKFTIINGNQLAFKAGATVDFETTPLHTLEITSTDQGGLSTTLTTLINITNFTSSFTGTSSSETITGTSEQDTINAGSGNDTVQGGKGADTLDGSSGTDTLSYASDTTGVTINLTTNSASGGDANGDTIANFENITGGTKNDTLTGNTGTNVLTGGKGADALDGGAGTDTANYSTDTTGVTVNLTTGIGSGGDAEGDTLANIEAVTGGTKNDTIIGNASNNTISGGTGDDTLKGEAGNDTLVGGKGADALDGGAGTDTISYSSDTIGVTVNLTTGIGSGGEAEGDTLTNIEYVTGGTKNDTLTGNASNNSLSGGAGNDTLKGEAGNDTLTGGVGADTMDGGAGTDTLNYSSDATGVVVNLATGSATGGEATGDIFSNFENLSGGTKNDTLTGSASNNTILGAAGNDTIYGEAGNDTLTGGAGADTMDGGDGVDTVSYSSDAVGVTVNLTTGIGSGGEATGDILTNIENITGGKKNDTLTGNTSNNTIDGGTGTDTVIFSGNRADYLIESVASNVLRVTGADGIDTLKNIEQLQFADTTWTNSATVSITSTLSVSEGAGSATVTIKLNAASTSDVTVTYATGNSSAKASSDYTSTSGTITFAAGETTKTVTIPIINNTTAESSETFYVTLTKATNAMLSTAYRSTITITDNDTTPIVLDMDQDGIQTISSNSGVVFDLDADGNQEQIGWMESGDALLVRDINLDGLISDGSELFGSATIMATGERAADGYEALRSFDTNQDSQINSSDTIFGELKLWRDANSDGSVDAGEMETLADAGVTSMSLSATVTEQTDNGNTIAISSTFTTLSANEQTMADVWFAVDAPLDMSGLADMVETTKDENLSSDLTESTISFAIEDENSDQTLFSDETKPQEPLATNQNEIVKNELYADMSQNIVQIEQEIHTTSS